MFIMSSPNVSSGSDDSSDPSDTDTEALIQIHFPTPLIVLAFTSLIPLALNIIYLICWYKFPSIRKTLGDILCFLALVFLLKDLSELALGIISSIVPSDSQKLNHFLCHWTSHTDLINVNFVYCYNIALTIHLVQVTQGSDLHTGHNSIWYHLTIWTLAIAAYLLTFFFGTLEQDIFGRCMHSIGAWNYVFPVIFTGSLLYSAYVILRVDRREGLLAQLRTMRFLRSFKVYLLLSCLYIVQEIIQLIFDLRLRLDNTKSFENVSLIEQVVIVFGYILGILFTYSVFVMRYIDPYVKSKIRVLLHLDKVDSYNDLNAALVDEDELRFSAIIPKRKLSPIYRRSVDSVRILTASASGVPAEVLVQEDLKKGYLTSIVVGIAYLAMKLEAIVERLGLDYAESANSKIEKTERLYIGEQGLQQGCVELYEIINNSKIPFYEGYLNVPHINMLIKMLWRDRDLLSELKRSIELRENIDGLRQGLRQEEGNIFFYTHDKRFLVKLIRDTKAAAFRKFTADLFNYQQNENIESCIENIIGTFQFSPHGLNLTHHFILIRNRFQEANTNLKEAVELKAQDIESIGEMHYLNKIKNLLRQVSELATRKEAIIRDIEFLSACGLYDYSLIFSLYKPHSVWDMKETVYKKEYSEGAIDIGTSPENSNGIDLEKSQVKNSSPSKSNSSRRFGKFTIGNLLQIKHIGENKQSKEYAQRMKEIVEVLFEKYMSVNNSRVF